ncbi:hypothetical protein [Phyllobacterium endophyticum]|uniref:Uncharacterized protein n=1 Tax=Phyllobacterium endophyticum TaxID=1149773 RepID=A0A2P7AUP7_9HYPH|nr:hypothetical protein [Phyllobacterium endophyticum]MBB3234425.1 hypothetical protein [Phyllobacterium endophyticum]PSH57938.1 hypothetical protein CU100_09645 [Phyllobacterium endophyticum]TYR44145.1 hypothetical protein FY050_02995 [Phyllobacterium endophyticum]
MDWLFSNWLTVVPLIGSAVAWAWAAVDRALTLRREQAQREWARLGELLVILNNKDNKHGYWSQIAAVVEMHGLRTKRSTVLRLAKEARLFWSNGATPALLTELDLLIADLER